MKTQHSAEPLSARAKEQFDCSMRDLLLFLEANFPDRAPSLATPDREILFKAGQVSVVRFLRKELELAEEDPSRVLRNDLNEPWLRKASAWGRSCED